MDVISGESDEDEVVEASEDVVEAGTEEITGEVEEEVDTIEMIDEIGIVATETGKTEEM